MLIKHFNMAKILLIHYKGRGRSAVFEAIHFLQTYASNLQKFLDEISQGITEKQILTFPSFCNIWIQSFL